MAFRRNVAFLDDCSPQLVELNSLEFLRVGRLLDAVAPRLNDARTDLVWQAAAADLCRQRLDEMSEAAAQLREGLRRASQALEDYAQALVRARAELADGDALAERLAGLLAPIIPYQSGVLRYSEPLLQWEDLREMTGVLDHFAELAFQDDIERIRTLADHYYRGAAHAYDRALAAEWAARQRCSADIDAALALLPRLVTKQNQAEHIIGNTPGLATELAEATSLDTGLRLPGQGTIPAFGIHGREGISDAHWSIIGIASHSAAASDGPTWDSVDSVHGYANRDWKEDGKLAWIHAYAPEITAAAARYGIPASVLAGVAFNEVWGKPMWLDDAVDSLREHNLYSGDPDRTSYGPMSVQVYTAAVALGYDPETLTAGQREAIITSLKSPEQAIMIAAKVLGDAKQDTDFALAEPDQMTAAQGRLLAAIYNGGADWAGPAAQSYADDYERNLPAAMEAIQ